RFYSQPEDKLYARIQQTDSEFIREKDKILSGHAPNEAFHLLKLVLNRPWMQENLNWHSNQIQEFVRKIVEPLLILYGDQRQNEFYDLLKRLAMEFMPASAIKNSLDKVVTQE